MMKKLARLRNLVVGANERTEEGLGGWIVGSSTRKE